MSTSIAEYLNFFRKTKSSYFLLREGKSPTVELDHGYGFFYILIPIVSFFIFAFLYTLSELLYDILGVFSFILITAIYLAFLLLAFIAFQATYFAISKKKTSFIILLKFNLFSIAKLFRIRMFYKQDNPPLPFIPSSISIPTPKTILPDQFYLFIGKSTGLLSSLWHTASLASNQDVLLNLHDSTKNILVLGGIGSGKTSAVMQPLLLQMLDQKCGGLIFDIKGDVKNTILTFASETSRNISIIGPHNTKINLLAGLTPEIASSFLKSSLLLANQGHLDLFWIDTATELSRNILGLLSFIPDHYHLASL